MHPSKLRNQYQFGRFRLGTDISLPLTATDSDGAECRASRVSHVEVRGEVTREYRGRTPGDTGSLRRDAGRYVMDFPGATFELDLAARTIGYAAANEPRDLFIDVVLPEFLGGLGELVLHGSAVLIDDRAVLLIGRSGSGKSTLALALVERGHVCVSDDFIPVVSGRTVAPGSRALNVWKDSASQFGLANARTTAAGKSSILHDRPAPARATIGAILFLESGSAPVEAADVKRDETLARVVESRYLLDPSNDAEVCAHLETAAGLAEQVPAARLIFRHDFARLPLVVETVERAVMEYA